MDETNPIRQYKLLLLRRGVSPRTTRQDSFRKWVQWISATSRRRARQNCYQRRELKSGTYVPQVCDWSVQQQAKERRVRKD